MKTILLASTQDVTSQDLVTTIQICQSNGLNDFVVVTGTNRIALEETGAELNEQDTRMRMVFAHHAASMTTGSAHAFWCAQDYVDEPYICFMLDHPPKKRDLRALVEHPGAALRLNAPTVLFKNNGQDPRLHQFLVRTLRTHATCIEDGISHLPVLAPVEYPLFTRAKKALLQKARHVLEQEHIVSQRPLIIGDEVTLPLGETAFKEQWPDATFFAASHNTFSACEEAKRLGATADMIIGFGGGRPLDVGKYVAQELQLDFVSMPTSPAHDGVGSKLAIIKDESNISQSLSMEKAPIAVLVDLNIIKNAPTESILSGTADLISNLSAVSDWRLAAKEQGESLDEHIAVQAEQSAQQLLDMLVEGREIKDDAYIEQLVNGLIASGEAMNRAGSSRPASGAEHKISHAIDALFPQKAGSHGLQVALGYLVSEVMRDHDISTLQKLYTKYGLPKTFADLGFSQEEALKILKYAPQTRDRYTILEHKAYSDNEYNEVLKQF